MIEIKGQGYIPTEQPAQETIKIPLKLHTIILLVGPSGSGKTQFAFEQLMIQLKMAQTGNKKINIQYISSDGIRRELLDNPMADKMDREMVYVSHQAFDILLHKLRMVTSYPVNADFIIVDTTGLDAQFRSDVLKIASENHYNVSAILFDYKNRKDYIGVVEKGTHGMVVSNKHVDRFKQTALSEIKTKDYTSVHRIKTREFEKYELVVENYSDYNSHILPFGPDYVVIGDVHGCYDELIALIKKHGFEIAPNKSISHPQNKKLVLVGDLVDKGYGVREIIEFAYANISNIYMVMGNHENYVYKHVEGLLDKDSIAPDETVKEYFSTISLLESDGELRMKFSSVVIAMKSFFIHRDFIITHAPCDVKYLGKLSPKGVSRQRNFKYPKQKDYATVEEFLAEKEKAFAFLKEQAHSNQPIHIFGHVMSKGIGRHANKLNIDTGCVAGGSLTSVIVTENGRLFFDSVSSKENSKIMPAELLEFFPRPKREEVSIDSLESSEKGRVLYAAKDKINFISGTVCPADKDEEKNQLESFDKAFEYYSSRGISKLVLQPKYMGSRANVYLFKDSSLNYTVTRNGFIVKQIDLTEAYKPLYDLPYIKQRFEEGMNMILLDAELMPWSAIGKQLIERDFTVLEKAIESEVVFLKENGFEEKLMGYYNDRYLASGYHELSHKQSKEDMKKMFGEEERNFRLLKQLIRSYVPVLDIDKFVQVYSKQLELYGTDKPIHFKPFSILKEVNNDGTEKLFFDSSNEFVYKAVSLDKCLVIDVNSEVDMQAAREFYADVTESQEMEGIMVKPYSVYNPGVAPCLKVRNPNYLTIIYGPDYTHEAKYKKLISKKSVKGKLKASINEFEIGKRMLEIPYAEIAENNKKYLSIVIDMIVEEKTEKELDPRL